MRDQVSFIIYYVLLLKIFFHSGHGFTYTIYDFRCRDVTDLDRLTYVSAVSLKECIRQCIRRRGCLSIVYKRLYPVCEMFGVDVSTFTKVNLDTSCTVVRRDDVTLDSAEVSSIVYNNLFIETIENIHYIIHLMKLLRKIYAEREQFSYRSISSTVKPV